MKVRQGVSDRTRRVDGRFYVALSWRDIWMIVVRGKRIGGQDDEGYQVWIERDKDA